MQAFLPEDTQANDDSDRKRLIAENDDFVSLAPFASRSPFEVSVFPKFHSSAFSRISPVQIEKLARVLRDVLQKLDPILGGPPYNLPLQDRPFLRPREGYWKTIEEDFHWHQGILPQLIGLTGFERGILVLLQPRAPGNCRPMSLLWTSAAPSRLSLRDTEVTEENLIDGNATQQFEVVEELSSA